MKKFSIQISQRRTVCRQVKAESIDKALEIAKELAQRAEGSSPVLRPSKGWALEWDDDCHVVGVFE